MAATTFLAMSKEEKQKAESELHQLRNSLPTYLVILLLISLLLN
jgi:hypothetical protein